MSYNKSDSVSLQYIVRATAAVQVSGRSQYHKALSDA